jgi:hypothetical protein
MYTEPSASRLPVASSAMAFRIIGSTPKMATQAMQQVPVIAADLLRTRVEIMSRSCSSRNVPLPP